MGSKKFDFPKSLYTVQECLYAVNSFRDENAIALDYFAGSGTTGHAVININREYGGNRKYILIEMGEYFNSVTKPRMQKIIYSSDWKDGKPVNRNTGVSHIMKYIRLESYEDTLTNIQLKDSDIQMSTLFGDDYLINYMLDLESKDSILNIDAFKMPFNYKLKITERNETKDKNIDLSETFNYLIGLNILHQSEITYFRSKPSENPIYEGEVTLKKDIDGDYAFKKIDGILPDGRHVLIIWRTITNDLIASNAALDAYYKEYCTNKDINKYDIIYVNGDNNLENLRTDDDSWKINLIELEFKKCMFENT